MIIGIHAKGAFKYERTGIEEYVYQIIKHFIMLDEAKNHIFRLFTPSARSTLFLPPYFRIESLYSPFFWTQGRLSLTLMLQPPEVLFMPANFLPLWHPKKSFVTIHGLEFEYYPEAYSPNQLAYLRNGTHRAVRHAWRIFAPSEATKHDLIKFYKADAEKIVVIPHGVNSQVAYHHRYPPIDEKYILFVGRLEKKKNVTRIIKAYSILKEKYRISHKLVLVGSPGYGFEEIEKAIGETIYKTDIVLTGYISHEEKESFFKYADVFVFPSLYEGFGMAVLEAQIRQVPVVTSSIASIKEIAGESALLVDPLGVEELTEAVYSVISDAETRKKLVALGLKNIQKYSWFKCAKQTLDALIS